MNCMGMGMGCQDRTKKGNLSELAKARADFEQDKQNLPGLNSCSAPELLNVLKQSLVRSCGLLPNTL
jgi:hypothetical protein